MQMSKNVNSTIITLDDVQYDWHAICIYRVTCLPAATGSFCQDQYQIHKDDLLERSLEDQEEHFMSHFIDINCLGFHMLHSKRPYLCVQVFGAERDACVPDAAAALSN